MTAEAVGSPAHPPAGEVERMLSALRQITAELLLDAPESPRSLRVCAGDVSVELEWPERATAAPAAAEPAVPAAPASTGQPAPGVGETSLLANTVGVFYRAPQPGAAPFVAEGDQITAGQQVGIIEVMKLMIPVTADRAGRISAVLVADGQPVEYGQPLFTVELDT